MKFEDLYKLTLDLTSPKSADERCVRWCGNAKQLGVSRQPNEGFELFLRGDALSMRSALVRRHLRHDVWRESNGNEFAATRIAFPADPHFQAVAAFVAEELFRNGLTESVPKAFAASEPILEMALRRTGLSDETIIGLIGELHVLNMLLLLRETPAERAATFEAWRGYQQSAHDFVFANVVIEVKTTRGSRSVHHVHNIGQVDPARAPDGAPLQHIHVISLGLVPLEADESPAGSFTLPSVVNDLLLKFGRSTAPGTPIADKFGGHQSHRNNFGGKRNKTPLFRNKSRINWDESCSARGTPFRSPQDYRRRA